MISDPGMQLQELAALVRQQAGDLTVYSGFLIAALDQSLPAENLQIERRASRFGRLRGKDGEVAAVSVRLGDKVYALRREGAGQAVRCEIQHQVSGIVLSRTSVSLAEWSLALAASLRELAETNAAAAAALSRLTNFTV